MQKMAFVALTAVVLTLAASLASAQIEPIDPEDQDRLRGREDVVVKAPKPKWSHRPAGTDLDRGVTPADKLPAVPFFDQDFISGPRPATASYEVNTLLVTAGKSYKIPVYWQEESGKVVPAPEWARHQPLGAGGVSVKDGAFSAEKKGILVILFWDAQAPQIRWASSLEVEVKPAKK